MTTKAEAVGTLDRPSALFVQVWLQWSWLPLVTRDRLGICFSWGPILCGYIRSDAQVRAHLESGQ